MKENMFFFMFVGLEFGFLLQITMFFSPKCLTSFEIKTLIIFYSLILFLLIEITQIINAN